MLFCNEDTGARQDTLPAETHLLTAKTLQAVPRALPVTDEEVKSLAQDHLVRKHLNWVQNQVSSPDLGVVLCAVCLNRGEASSPMAPSNPASSRHGWGLNRRPCQAWG